MSFGTIAAFILGPLFLPVEWVAIAMVILWGLHFLAAALMNL